MAVAATLARLGANVRVVAVAVVKTENLDGLVVGRAEPVRKLRVELGNLAGAHRDVVLTEDQPRLAAQDVLNFN